MNAQKPNIIIKPDAMDNESMVEALFEEIFGFGRFAKAAHWIRKSSCPNYELSRVAYDNNQLIGACRISEITLNNKEKSLFLGPIAVNPKYRHLGIAASMINEIIDAGVKSNFPHIFLIGDLSMFSRFGFEKMPDGLVDLPLPVQNNRLLWRK